MNFLNIFWSEYTNNDRYFYFRKDIGITFDFNRNPYNSLNGRELVFSYIEKDIIIKAIDSWLEQNEKLPSMYDTTFGAFDIILPDDIIFYAKLSGLT